MGAKEVVCPVCLGKKKIAEGQSWTDKMGFYRSIRRIRRCCACNGKGKGDFDIAYKGIRAQLAFMEIAQGGAAEVARKILEDLQKEGDEEDK